MTASLEELTVKLDALLERYLMVLDSYEQARRDMSKQMSSGFFALAKANRSAHGGRRYGQDFYDYRMQASNRVKVDTTEPLQVTIVQPVAKVDDAIDERNDANRDPILWFGVLVPPPLRDAQSDFTRTVDSHIPNVINIATELRQLEINVGRTRKAIKKLEKA